MDIDQLKKELLALDPEQRKKLLSDMNLDYYGSGEYLDKAQEEKEVKTAIRCPHCSSKEVISRGSHKGVKKLQCKSCGKYFSGNYGTALHGIHKKEKWQRYIECMHQGLSIKKSAKKVGISYQTAFNWRHKILSSTNELTPKQLEGIVEADDTFFPYSEKGQKQKSRKPRKRGNSNMTLKENKVPVVVSTDRKGNAVLSKAGRGSVKRKDLQAAMAGKFHPEAILCSDGAMVYKGLAIKEGIQHVKSAVHGRPVAKNKAYNIQSVNQLHKDLKVFMSKFNGVSTKYLQNYLNWFMTHKKKLSDADKIRQIIWISLTYAAALEYYQVIKTSAS